MRRIYLLAASFCMMLFLSGGAVNINAQDKSKERFTGTVLFYGSGLNTRTSTREFTLDINNLTSDSDAQKYLGVLQESGQNKLLDAIENKEIGRFSVGANVGVPINVIRENTVDGKRRIFIVFKRWTQFAELRGGYRSLDYPFGVIELFINPQTGKGEGTYIAAAQIRWKNNNRNGQQEIEIENFATYPAKLLGVTRR